MELYGARTQPTSCQKLRLDNKIRISEASMQRSATLQQIVETLFITFPHEPAWQGREII